MTVQAERVGLADAYPALMSFFGVNASICSRRLTCVLNQVCVHTPCLSLIMASRTKSGQRDLVSYAFLTLESRIALCRVGTLLGNRCIGLTTGEDALPNPYDAPL